MDQFNIPYEVVEGAKNTVELTFEEIVAKDCNNSFVSNHINPYNLNHTTFGCSTALNQVQMVSDKTQFTNPKLLGSYDGQKAVQNAEAYLAKEKVMLDVGDFSAVQNNSNN